MSQQKQQESTEAREEFEGEVVERMVAAKAIVDAIFPGLAVEDKVYATEEVSDYLEIIEAEEFLPDLKRAFEAAQTIYEMPPSDPDDPKSEPQPPTPGMVFGVLDRFYPNPPQ